MPKKKSYIKTNIIAFTIIGLLFTGIGVYAAVTFPSNEVSYDNKTSGLKSTNVKGAIDELYTACTSKTPAEEIIENAKLEKDPYECRYFFTGANPNNYITFNGEKAGWRIISAECDGTIKIIKIEVLDPNRAWSTATYYYWDTASINTYLNGTYYNSLTQTAKSQIISHNFSVGSVGRNDHNNLENQINDENKTIWNGKVALATLSEYLRSHSDTSKCGTFNLANQNVSTCKDITWMNTKNDMWWTITPYYSTGAYSITPYGQIQYSNQTLEHPRPTVYLSSKVKITGGNGSSSNPYQISL